MAVAKSKRDKEVKKLEEDKADWQAWVVGNEELTLALPDASSVTTELEHVMMQVSQDWIQLCKQEFSDADRELAKKRAALALSDVENRDLFTEAKKDGLVKQATSSTAMFGFNGTGKTHVQAIILKEPPPSKRVSTAVAQVPARAIGHLRMSVDQAKTEEKPKFIRIADGDFSNSFLKTAKERIIRCRLALNPMKKLQMKFRRLVFTPAMPSDQVEKELIVKFHQSEANVESLENQVVIEMSDCGGQPQFLEVLPRFIDNISLGIIVIDLSQRFDEHPYTAYYNDQGILVGDGVKYVLSNEQIIRLCLRMVASQSRGERLVRILVVGTHRDLESTCSQSREEKNRILMAMVESFGLGKSVVFRNRGELIFAIDAKHPKDEDQQTAEELREVILDQSAVKVIPIPVSYHGVELTLKEMVRESGHIAFQESEVLKAVSHYYLTEASLKGALRYLHQHKRIFYFEKEFPGLVFGEPQAILNKHTEVVAHLIELTTNPSKRPVDGVWRKFCECGILRVDCLRKFPDHYVEGVFTPVDMMRLFEKLLIVSEVSDGEFLMPSVLPAVPQASCNPEPETQSAPPMLLHFPGGPVRYGIFCSTVCHLMTDSKWKLFKSPGSEEPFHITRNSVHFAVPGYLGKITLNDPFDSFFLVTVHIPSDTPSYQKKLLHLCVKVHDTLIHAIDDVTKKLNYSPDSPQPAFLCQEHASTSLHAATVSEFGDELLCTKFDVRGGVMTDQHRVWLKDHGSFSLGQTTTDSATPTATPTAANKGAGSKFSLPPFPANLQTRNTPLSLKSLTLIKWRDEEGHKKEFRLADQVSSRWRDFGKLLDLPKDKLDAWNSDFLNSSARCWDEVMQHWLDEGSEDYPVSWEGLYKLLEDARYQDAASALLVALKSANCCH